MKVVGYARVSTDLQREKETIKTQIEMTRESCKRDGHDLIGFYLDDGVSGTIPLSQRPEGRKLMAAAQRGEFEAVMVYKSDRIGRDVLINETVASELYEKLGIKILGVAETIDLTTPDGRMMFTFHSVLGRMERENTLMRSQNATVRLAREGVWLGGICPFGYRVEGKDKEARLTLAEDLIPDLGMSEVDIVKSIYEMSANEGLSCIHIANRLNALGVPTSYIRDGREVERNKRKQKTRGVWRPARVRNMIVETTYKGVHQWGKRGSKRRTKDNPREIIERAVPVIVDEDTWRRAQETLRKNRMLRPDVQKRPYLLRGLMKCSHCGLTYIGTANKGRSVHRLSPTEMLTAEVRQERVLNPYYQCNGKGKQNHIFGTGERCTSLSLKAQEIENLVWSDLEDFLQNPGEIVLQLREVLEHKLADTEGLQKAMAKLESGIQGKEAERANLFRLARRNQMSDAMLDIQLKEIEGEEAILKQEMLRIEGDLRSAQNANESLLSAENTLSKLKLSLESGISWETKRRVVEALVEGIEVETVMAEQGKVPRLKVKYRFEMPSFVSEVAQATIGTGVRAGFYSAA